jgi:hypothetical protein
MSVCGHSRLPLALKLERRASLAGFVVNAVAAGSLGLLFVVILPPPDGALMFSPGVEMLAIAAFTIATALTAYRTAPSVVRGDARMAGGGPAADGRRVPRGPAPAHDAHRRGQRAGTRRLQRPAPRDG